MVILFYSTLNTIFFFVVGIYQFLVNSVFAPSFWQLKLVLIFIFIWLEQLFQDIDMMLMRLGWKVFLPISLGFNFYCWLLLAFDGSPNIFLNN
jgi:hypothetical protein